MALWLQLDVLHSQAQRLVRDRCRWSASEGSERAAPACLLAVDEFTPASRLVLSYWRCAPLHSTLELVDTWSREHAPQHQHKHERERRTRRVR